MKYSFKTQSVHIKINIIHNKHRHIHNTLFPKQFCPHLIRSCHGCTQPLRPGGLIAIPPYDLVIMSRMNREFCDPVTGVSRSRSKEGNVYFHVHLVCLRRKQPYFKPQMAVVPRELFQHLRPEHMCLLQQFGVNRLPPPPPPPI